MPPVELKRCPFCGGLAYRQSSGGSYKVVCSRCSCYQQGFLMSDAEESWNTRYEPKQSIDEELFKALRQLMLHLPETLFAEVIRNREAIINQKDKDPEKELT